jgi:hypothetical protein
MRALRAAVSSEQGKVKGTPPSNTVPANYISHSSVTSSYYRYVSDS